MKALQELVTNANKTDKASMLDEIIDYVRFLQLQVKGTPSSNLANHVDFAKVLQPIQSQISEFPIPLSHFFWLRGSKTI
ncbi:hypothetical protein AAZV13_02G169600 [Glycine max]|uniref:Transcription factor bHLH66 isoform A n=2 Tax=Glycine subgen. Soja TaxID=1462606 RepID=A0A445LRS6_GLYSO|nr:Transcription factor bHLH66 isoform A [Glycine soja]RZC25895.1 Transcription factor bHLH66 isoform B [Glycine soja]RZC25896.1 Transcription factor bHLH66 isoform C [Glycine soja]